MFRKFKHLTIGLGAILGIAMSAPTVQAADYTDTATSYAGNWMVRVGASVVAPDSSADVFAAGTLVPTHNAEVSTEVVPTATIAYFFTPNIAAELFCCFAKHDVEGRGTLAGLDLGDTWIFPPAVTLQYHFTQFGRFKPYVGAGFQYIAFFDESTASGLGGAQLDIDDSIGATLQIGFDYEIQDGWYFNADLKKTFFEMDAAWAGTGVTADVTLDPWIVTVAVGRRFNLGDLFR